jgi:hypothetical protein
MFADQPPPKATAVRRQWYAVWQRRVHALNPYHAFQTYFNLFAPTGYALGVNVVLYVMTH